MSSTTNFDSTKLPLKELLSDIKSGKLQLPDFQRGWIWDDEHIKSLLASVSMSYPIGIIMTLTTGDESVHFKPRLIDGVKLDNPPYPERFILDGQQRLTSLFLSLLSDDAVETKDAKGRPIKRWYYLDIAQALSPNGDKEEAIISLHEDRCIRNFRGEIEADYSTIEKECEAELFPLRVIFDGSAWMKWVLAYLKVHPEHQDKLTKLDQDVVQRFEQYLVPVIALGKETPKEAVCNVFEKVNTGGVALTVFELLTATYAADNYSLRDHWEAIQGRLAQFQSKVLKKIENTDFLQTVTLLATYNRSTDSQEAAVSCKRKDVLKLSLEDYKMYEEQAIEGYEAAAELLHTQKFFTTRDVPYRTQFVPLAAILAVLGKEGKAEGARAKILRWFWCGIFGELYGSATETRFAKDLPDVVSWVRGGPEPITIQDAHFAPDRILTLKTRNSAAYKGLSALLLTHGAQDFCSGETIDVLKYFEKGIDIHHIFPQAYCKEKHYPEDKYDCIVNKTPLSAYTNRIIGSNPPKIYLPRLQRKAGISDDKLQEILISHAIDPNTLFSNDFYGFFEDRKWAFLNIIEKAMGKPLAGDGYEF
ncbi:MAG: GmrSD restriction endonuclease domain-containing protein [Halobacteriota archaeon]